MGSRDALDVRKLLAPTGIRTPDFSADIYSLFLTIVSMKITSLAAARQASIDSVRNNKIKSFKTECYCFRK
jgi:hypothetical protein